MLRLNILLKIPTAYNTGLAKVGRHIMLNLSILQAHLRQARKRYVQGYETAYKRAFVISIAFGLMSQPIKFRFSSLQTTAVVPLPK